MKEPLEIVERFMRLTNEKHDINGAMGLMADNVKFTGPAAQCKNKQEYREMLEKFIPIHAGWKKHQAFENGNDVCFIDDVAISTPQGDTLTLEVSEWFKVANGKIKEHKIFYDPAAFKTAFSLH